MMWPMTTTQQRAAGRFLFNEALNFELIDGGLVRFTVMALGAGESLYELCIEAHEVRGVVSVDALHGFDEADKPLELSADERAAVESWAMASNAVESAADHYFENRVYEVLSSAADEAGWVST